MITSRASIYLVYAILVLFTFFGDKLLKRPTRPPEFWDIWSASLAT